MPQQFSNVGMTKALFAQLLFVIFSAAALPAQTLSLSPQSWTEQFTPPDAIPRARAVHFSETGKEISVGPWIAGLSKPRLVFKESFPAQEGSIHGRFRTENLYPREGIVWITYKKGEQRLSELSYWLGVSDHWESFTFPIIKPPAGCDAIAVSFGFATKTPGRLHLTGLEMGGPFHLPAPPAQKPSLTRAKPSQSFKPGPYIRLEKTGNSWWLVDTTGKPFISFGTAMYGNRMKPEENFPALRDLHINSLANGHDEKQWSAFNDKQVSEHAPFIYQFHTVASTVGPDYDTLVDARANNPGMSQADAVKIGGFNHAFPDPYDPRWEAYVRKNVHETALLFKDKPYFAAWEATNERSHTDLYRFVWSTHCTVEFGVFLKAKYPSVDGLNKAWKTSYGSFDDVLAQKPEPVVSEGAMYEDFRLFSRQIVRHFNDTMLRVIHEEDPGRLVFTNRFMIGEVRDVFENIDLYSGFDAIAVNIYPSNDVWGLDAGEREYLALLHTKTGKPLIITEWSVPARDSGLYDDPAHYDWSYSQTVATQQERALQAATLFAEFYNTPYMLGAHWFSWSDFDSKQRQANRGLFKANYQPWPEVQKAFKDVVPR